MFGERGLVTVALNDYPEYLSLALMSVGRAVH